MGHVWVSVGPSLGDVIGQRDSEVKMPGNCYIVGVSVSETRREYFVKWNGIFLNERHRSHYIDFPSSAWKGEGGQRIRFHLTVMFLNKPDLRPSYCFKRSTFITDSFKQNYLLSLCFNNNLLINILMRNYFNWMLLKGLLLENPAVLSYILQHLFDRL